MIESTLTNAVVKLKLLPTDHRELLLRCDYHNGNNIINSTLTDSIEDWYPLEDNESVVVHIKMNEFNVFSIEHITDGFIWSMQQMLDECIYPINDEDWDG